MAGSPRTGRLSRLPLLPYPHIPSPGLTSPLRLHLPVYVPDGLSACSQWYSRCNQLLYFIRIHAVSSSLFLPCFAVFLLSCCFMLFMFYFTIVVKIVVKTPSNKYKAGQKEKAPRQQGFHSFKALSYSFPYSPYIPLLCLL